MSAADVTREEWPLHFAIADAVNGTVRPFDMYQGPYISVGTDLRGGSGVYATTPRIPGVVRLWVQDDNGFAQVYNEDTEKLSEPFWPHGDDSNNFAAEAALEVCEPAPLGQFLAEWFPEDKYIVSEVTDLEQIRSLHASMTSSTWAAGPIEGTPYYKLAQLSPMQAGDLMPIAVCRISALEVATA